MSKTPVFPSKNYPKFSKKDWKKWSTKSFLNLHFKGFGAITRSDSNRALKTVHFGIGEVPKCPTDDRFMKIWVFFAISVGRRVPFFGHSLLSYSKRRHLSTSRVIPLIDCHQSLYHQHRIRSTIFFRPLFYMAEPWISIFGLCPPYRNLTCPYGPKKPSTWIQDVLLVISCSPIRLIMEKL